ncbi:hypothetical protein [Streptomyces echinatus]|uniref:hypothetical protein n=1 Tax=Streptomyces echinatus TaxID=67293 RepID=UPI0037B75DED
MSVSRVDFATLPHSVHQAVLRHTGPVRSIRSAATGRKPALAVVLGTDAGPVFVKGIPANDPQAASQRREAALTPYVAGSSPRLLWQLEAAGWLLAGWEAVHGRHADYQSPEDLRLVRTALEAVQAHQAPDEVELPTAQERWGRYADEDQAELFAGDVLLQA